MPSTRTLVDHAKHNGGVFTIQDAASLGVSKWMISTRVNEGLFARVGRGIYALPGTATRPDLQLRIACHVLGAVVSHESAGLIHGLSPLRAEAPTVTVSHRSTHKFEGVIVHQSTDLLEAHLVSVDGILLTNPTRTIVDLSQTTSSARLERVIDNALAAGLVDLQELSDLHAALARKGKRGVRNLRAILDQRRGVVAGIESDLESLLLGLIRRSQLPEPVIQFRAPWLRSVEGRVDFAYVEERLILEADGRRWHALNDAFESDRRRDNAAQIAGWRVLRFTWRMIVDEPMEVVASIRHALAASVKLSRER